MLVRDERTNRLLASLSWHLDALRASARSGQEPPVLKLARDEIENCRDTWESAVLRGEHHLYDFAALLAQALTGSKHVQHVARVVMGRKEEEEGPGTQRIVIEETITRENLKRVTDYSLAQRIARRYRYRASHDQPFGVLYPRASFLELWPLETIEDAPATRVLTRVKTNDQIWNKVCDALFAVDTLVRRDKIVNTDSKYINDIFGVKVLTPRRADSYRVEEILAVITWTVRQLAELGVVTDPGHLHLELVEHKDYLSVPTDQKKKTGWEAIKNVYRWGAQLFEVQIQTEANYFLEALHLTDTSHRTFEMKRRQMRRELEKVVPHYADYRRLLKLLFRREDDEELHALEESLPWLEII
ncbi:MAG: hypothetical protein JNJ59_27240 [Deltaproteobacteria bacterium]|nr:hypothetical protein [Deltaproteobacteria bacterium]